MATPEKMHGGVPVNENMKAQVRTDAAGAGSLVSAQLSPATRRRVPDDPMISQAELTPLPWLTIMSATPSPLTSARTTLPGPAGVG